MGMADSFNTLPLRHKSLVYILATLAHHPKFGSSFLSSTGSTLRFNNNLSAENNVLREKSPFQTRTFFPLRNAAEPATAVTSNDDDDDAAVKLAVPPGILGPPEPLRSLKVGQYLNAFRTTSHYQHDGDDGDDETATATAFETKKVQFTIERMARTPDVFHLRNFVTQFECACIQSAALDFGTMENAGTVTEGDTTSRKNCSVAWISSPNNNSNNSTSSSSSNAAVISSNLVSSTANIFLSRDVMSQPSAGVEDLQVLRYGTGGEFVHHHDGEPRVLTVIYYINGVGGTWFPLACTSDDGGDGGDSGDSGGATEDDVRKRRVPMNKAQALNLVKGLQPGKHGLLVKGTVRRDVAHSKDTHNNNDCDDVRYEEEINEHVAWVDQGDAIAFYNYKDDGSARLDWTALHCGLPTTEEEGTKWIANHWYGVNSLADM
mmetsp:Transcript_18804/g.40928  ORF Transcript_18804/g.40928 Transcript_18804/m.40928 type:complete len:433 (+) Transcript_18804:145-1443(+)